MAARAPEGHTGSSCEVDTVYVKYTPSWDGCVYGVAEVPLDALYNPPFASAKNDCFAAALDAAAEDDDGDGDVDGDTSEQKEQGMFASA